MQIGIYKATSSKQHQPSITFLCAASMVSCVDLCNELVGAGSKSFDLLLPRLSPAKLLLNILTTDFKQIEVLCKVKDKDSLYFHGDKQGQPPSSQLCIAQLYLHDTRNLPWPLSVLVVASLTISHPFNIGVATTVMKPITPFHAVARMDSLTLHATSSLFYLPINLRAHECFGSSTTGHGCPITLISSSASGSTGNKTRLTRHNEQETWGKGSGEDTHDLGWTSCTVSSMQHQTATIRPPSQWASVILSRQSWELLISVFLPDRMDNTFFFSLFSSLMLCFNCIL